MIIGALGMLLVFSSFGFRSDTDELGHLTVRSLTVEDDRGVIMGYLGKGYLQTYNQFGEPTLFIGTGKDGGGYMRAFNGSGDESAYVGTGRMGGGYIRTYNNSGKETTYLGTGSDNAGQIRVYNNDGETGTYIGNSYLQAYNQFGERTFFLGRCSRGPSLINRQINCLKTSSGQIKNQKTVHFGLGQQTKTVANNNSKYLKS